MKILVFDDSYQNLRAAWDQLKGHEVHTVQDYNSANKLLSDNKAGFDVVLVDLMVPAPGNEMMGEGRKFIGQEMPIGIFIGLLAGAAAGAKFCAVLTDTNHHHHPASACLDNYRGRVFMVNDCKTIFSNSPNWIGVFSANDMSKELVIPDGISEYEFEKAELESGRAVKVKNWAGLLEKLLTGKSVD